MSSEGDIRARVKDVVEDEFSDEGWTVEDDKLGASAGMDGRTRVAVSPLRSREDSRVAVQLNVEVLLQVYLPYSATPDSDIAVDPTLIEGYAQRIRDAFRGEGSSGSTSAFWGLRVREVEYPDDPTGNKSRLEATILGYGDNTAVVGP